MAPKEYTSLWNTSCSQMGRWLVDNEGICHVQPDGIQWNGECFPTEATPDQMDSYTTFTLLTLFGCLSTMVGIPEEVKEAQYVNDDRLRTFFCQVDLAFSEDYSCRLNIPISVLVQRSTKTLVLGKTVRHASCTTGGCSS